MNNVFKKVLFLLTVISAYFVYDYKNVYATELSDEEKISIINHIDDSVDSIDVRFDENIPYVKLDDIYSFMSHNEITISKKDDGIYEVTTEGGKATINITMDYLYSDNLGAFIEIPENLIRSNRKFYIIRLHNGSATKIIPTLNENILTFETDKFSIYALAYIDAGETKFDT